MGMVAEVYPGWKGVTQPCDVCGRLVAVNAVSPSECLCSHECGERLYLADAPSGVTDAGLGPGRNT